ncbi:sensor histidine kinase [Jatrophihabitans sp.]|uniref:sensor histidine kinase n=1 Tax=Jatrophihabitans sp. TaxID=1932789 RepID=UPI002BF34ADD|nr:HAMP domain-containing sensor histidine kinase [Jatrophihabitans sp.]
MTLSGTGARDAGPAGQQAPLGPAPLPPPVLFPPPEPPARRPGRRARWLPRTLAARLVTGVVALLLVVVTITGATTYFLLRPFLLQRLDQQLTSVAAGNATSVRQCILSGGSVCSVGVPSGGRAAQLATAQREWIVGYDSDGNAVVNVTANIASLTQLNLSDRQRADVLADPTQVRTITSGAQRLRVTARQIQIPGDTVTVVTGLSMEEVDHTLQRLLLLELVVGASAVLLAAGLTSWGVRAGLRPLTRVTRTAQEVTAELSPQGSGLDLRVPDADPRTEVGKVASALNTLLQTVETEFAARVRSEERMRQFLADASHELRTPLTSIRGYAELARLQGRSTGAPDDSMRRIEVEGTRMSRLVEDLLVLARGDQASALQRELVEVDKLLAEAAHAVSAAHPERELTIAGSGGAVLVGDRDQLLRVLINLASNSAIHTPSGPIRLEAIRGRTPAGEAVALRVTDTGPGLPPEEAAHVFERFWRADKARSRAKGGSGLGMAIVAQIVAAHGGHVEFDSTVAGGTTVTVTLPVQPPVLYPPPA